MELKKRVTKGTDYDFIVIGAGPAGQKGAIQAAKLRKRVLMIDQQPQIGGVSAHQGTIPSKSFREAVLHLSGYRQRNMYGSGYRVKSEITMEDLNYLMHQIERGEVETTTAQLKRNHIEWIQGRAKFISDHEVEIESEDGATVYRAARFLIATGARPARGTGIELDGEAVFDSDDLLRMTEIPRSMVVIGGGVVGLEYASMFAVLGVEVTVVDARERLLEFADQEIIESLKYRLRSQGVIFRVGEFVEACARRADGRVTTQLRSGKVIVSDRALYSAGRVSCIEDLGLEAIGIEATPRGTISVDDHLRTVVSGIFAAGDVTGFPALASTAAEQGRLAACYAFDDPVPDIHIPLPYCIYSIPEVAMVGSNEQELTTACTPYEVGVARYRELTKAALSGDQDGLLKIIFHRETRKLLGAHVIGEDASEIIHIGQLVMAFQGTVDHLVRTVFNYPTFSNAYKVAALDGLNKLQGREAGE